MRSVRVLLAAAFAAAVAAGPGAQEIIFQQRGGPPLPQRDVEPEKTGTSVLRGRVVAEDSGAPLRRVMVRLTGTEVPRPA